MTFYQSKNIKQEKNLAFLNLNECGLISLKNFPKIENLVHLELSLNNFPPSEINELCVLTNIQSISLCNLKINTIEELKPLTKLENLLQLDLTGNPITEIKDYRQTMFKEFKKLEFLDHKDAEGKEYEYSSDEDIDDDEEDEDEDDEDNSELSEDDDD